MFVHVKCIQDLLIEHSIHALTTINLKTIWENHQSDSQIKFVTNMATESILELKSKTEQNTNDDAISQLKFRI